MKKCTNPDCNAAIVSSDKKFCNACGSPLAEMEATPPEEIKEPIKAALSEPENIKKAKGNSALIASLVGIIIILASVISFLFLKPIIFKSSTAENVMAGIEHEENTTEQEAESESYSTEAPKADLTTPAPVTAEEERPVEPEIIEEKKPTEPLYSEIVQVDSSNFPNVSIYVNLLNNNGDIPKELNLNDFEIYEIDNLGKTVTADISTMRQILVSDSVSVNLVLDVSGSMDDDNKMEQAQYAASIFLSQLGGSSNDLVEITAFDDYVYVPQAFTNNYSALTSSIYNLKTGGQTALNDAIYSALLTTNLQKGAKCVIVFTDGLENRSSYTYNDVVSLAQATGIPLYIIGIGRQCDDIGLTALANTTNGRYYSAETSNLGEALSQIYSEIYNMQRGWYLVEYRSRNQEDLQFMRQIKFSAKQSSIYSGESSREYIPKPVINQSFSDKYKNQDYILNFTSTRPVQRSDLVGLSLAELRIARNEIFARYGRQFKDPLLNKWFYSKSWYLRIMPKYSPADFDKIPTPLTKLEQDNTAAILEYEQYIMNNERIFPQSSTVKLTEYDLSLLKPVLTRALEEIYIYAGNRTRLNDVEHYNAELIERALQQDEIAY